MNFFEKLGLSVMLVCLVPAFTMDGVTNGVATFFLMAGFLLFVIGDKLK